MYAFWTIITWLMKYFAGNSINYPVTFQTLLTNIYNPTFIYWYLYALMLMYLFYSITKIKQIDIDFVDKYLYENPLEFKHDLSHLLNVKLLSHKKEIRLI